MTNNIKEERLAGLRRHSEEVNKLVVESLQGALLLLIGKKPYESITVTELCKKAGVSRMAFYGNFRSKDEIFERIVTDLHREMLSRIGSPFRQKITVAWYEDMLRFVSEKSFVLEPIFAAGFRDKYLELVNTMVLRHKDMSEEDTFLRILWNGGIINVVVYWLIGGKKQPPEQVAAYCYRCFSDLLPTTYLSDVPEK